jgi:polar amino acid transport system permease protein
VSHDPGTTVLDTPPLLLARRRLLTGRRAVVVSALSTVVVLGGLIAVFYLAPGGAAVRAFFFDPHQMWVSLRGNPAKSLSSIGGGIVTNIWMFLVCEVLVLIFGLLIAWVRLTQSAVMFPLRLLSTIYTDVFRGIPILLVIFIVGYGLPAR